MRYDVIGRLALGITVALLFCAGVEAQDTASLSANTGAGAIPGGTANVEILLTHGPGSYDGWSFGVAHDGAVLTAGLPVAGAAIDPAQGGATVAFFIPQIVTGGVTVGLLVSLDPAVTIPAATDAQIVTIDYTVGAGVDPATTTTTSLTFTAGLGTPPVDMIVVMGATEVIPTTTPGTLNILTPFSRGDVNEDGTINLLDPVTLLYRHIGAPPPLPPGTCEDAEDANNDGTVDVADAIFLISFLFGDPGPPNPAPAPPAPPFGACGGDLDGGPSAGCTAFACP